MKLFHISDLHIGKQLHEYSLRKEQEAVLTQLIGLLKEHQPDVLLIAGDIYDKSVPSAEAGAVFDAFLTQLSELKPNIPTMIISGNHDNAVRLNFGSSFFEKHGIYVSTMPPQNEEEFLKKVTLQDEYGEVHFYLLPFIKPGYVRHLFEEGVVTDYNSAVKAVIEREHIDTSCRNVLIAHQFFVSGADVPDTCDSESRMLNIGGLDSVDVDCVRKFDYVALGHLHGRQRIGEDYIRYSGTPVKYSVSEEHHTKSVTVVNLLEKGKKVQIDYLPFHTERDVRSVRGSLEEVLSVATEENCDDYVSVTLTDEDSIYRPKDRLEEAYHNILEVRVDNARTRAAFSEMTPCTEVLSPMEAFRQFYQEMNAQPLSEEEEEVMREVIDTVTDRQVEE